jgi:hypothetical protein
VNTTIALFLLFGAAFGWATHANRHLFSEGPTRRGASEDTGVLDGRVVWTLLCTFLWPLMALSGLNSLWLLAQRRRAARAAQTPRR